MNPLKGEAMMEGFCIDEIYPTAWPGVTGKDCEIGTPKGSCTGVKIFFIWSQFHGVELAPLSVCEQCAKAASEAFGVPITKWVDKQPYGSKESWPLWNVELDCGNGGPKKLFRFQIQAPTEGRAEELAFVRVEAEYWDVDTLVLEKASKM